MIFNYVLNSIKEVLQDYTFEPCDCVTKMHIQKDAIWTMAGFKRAGIIIGYDVETTIVGNSIYCRADFRIKPLSYRIVESIYLTSDKNTSTIVNSGVSEIDNQILEDTIKDAETINAYDRAMRTIR